MFVQSTLKGEHFLTPKTFIRVLVLSVPVIVEDFMACEAQITIIAEYVPQLWMSFKGRFRNEYLATPVTIDIMIIPLVSIEFLEGFEWSLTFFAWMRVHFRHMVFKVDVFGKYFVAVAAVATMFLLFVLRKN
jgi:hypothetical protein